ncbi:potassium channel family protein [Paraburkholderia sp. J7]|uniref:potassium channel family protein n=1 Tax=Paraburkholderia sp. J7 TaxID=2805438 RepID=UPI002AB5F3B4|nr:potassium channel family protein [Paraburkholderia sp. J7]
MNDSPVSGGRWSFRAVREIAKDLFVAGRPVGITYLSALFVIAIAPDKDSHHGWSVVAMSIALALMILTYPLGLRLLRRWFVHLGAKGGYVSLWVSYLVTTLLFQQPLWLICQKFALIDSPNALDNAYFTLVTFLTIGYGDMVPHSGPGRAFAMVVGILGAAHNICFISYLLTMGQSAKGIET